MTRKLLQQQRRRQLPPVRDRKNPTGPVLLFAAHAWAAFVEGLRAG
ncbi:DUF397 domain-containing protein [Streptomyces sp. NPDC050848]